MHTPDLKRLLTLQKKMPARPWLFTREGVIATGYGRDPEERFCASLNGAKVWTDSEDVARFLELAVNLVDCLEPAPRNKAQEVQDGEKRNKEAGSQKTGQEVIKNPVGLTKQRSY